jgi:hypothetical protein
MLYRHILKFKPNKATITTSPSFSTFSNRVNNGTAYALPIGSNGSAFRYTCAQGGQYVLTGNGATLLSISKFDVNGVLESTPIFTDDLIARWNNPSAGSYDSAFAFMSRNGKTVIYGLTRYNGGLRTTGVFYYQFNDSLQVFEYKTFSATTPSVAGVGLKYALSDDGTKMAQWYMNGTDYATGQINVVDVNTMALIYTVPLTNVAVSDMCFMPNDDLVIAYGTGGLYNWPKATVRVYRNATTSANVFGSVTNPSTDASTTLPIFRRENFVTNNRLYMFGQGAPLSSPGAVPGGTSTGASIFAMDYDPATMQFTRVYTSYEPRRATDAAVINTGGYTRQPTTASQNFSIGHDANGNTYIYAIAPGTPYSQGDQVQALHKIKNGVGSVLKPSYIPVAAFTNPMQSGMLQAPNGEIIVPGNMIKFEN